VGPKKPALFLDRDGVVNRNHGYVHEISDFEFFPEIFEICRIAKSSLMPIVIVTNQSGIGRGYFRESDFEILTEWMLIKFQEEGIQIDGVFHAPENPDKPIEAESSRRKPSPTMITEAAVKLEIDLSNSILIGDNESDMIAAMQAGINHRILIGIENNPNATLIVTDHNECSKAVRDVISGMRDLKTT
jgi:D-glycero-D-manno-heptose 1,7-bisphosphate phosphatase